MTQAANKLGESARVDFPQTTIHKPQTTVYTPTTFTNHSVTTISPGGSITSPLSIPQVPNIQVPVIQILDDLSAGLDLTISTEGTTANNSSSGDFFMPGVTCGMLSVRIFNLETRQVETVEEYFGGYLPVFSGVVRKLHTRKTNHH